MKRLIYPRRPKKAALYSKAKVDMSAATLSVSEWKGRRETLREAKALVVHSPQHREVWSLPRSTMPLPAAPTGKFLNTDVPDALDGISILHKLPAAY